MDQQDLSLDLLLQETLALSEFLRSSNIEKKDPVIPSSDDTDYLLDLADSLLDEPVALPIENIQITPTTEV